MITIEDMIAQEKRSFHPVFSFHNGAPERLIGRLSAEEYTIINETGRNFIKILKDKNIIDPRKKYKGVYTHDRFFVCIAGTDIPVCYIDNNILSEFS